MHRNLLNVELELLAVVLLFILFRWHARMKQQNGFRSLVAIYFLTFIAAISNVIRLAADWQGMMGAVIHISTIIYFACVGLIGLFWLLYCGEQFGLKKAKSLVARLLCGLPLVLVMMSALLFPGNGWVYFVDAAGRYHRGAGYFILLTYCAYLLAVAVLSLLGRSQLSIRAREERTQLVWASVPALFLGALPQMLMPGGLTPMTLAIAVSLLTLLVNSQYKKIVIDNLTKLPNRYGMDEEFEEQLEQYRRDKNDSFYIIACDMDNFKTINDTWGHAEGDRALQLIADVLTRVADRNNAMAFRNGGDEFVIITDQAEKGLAESVCRQVKEELDVLHFRDDFTIEMSMGIALFDGKSSIAELMNRADSSLYDVKREKKSETEPTEIP